MLDCSPANKSPPTKERNFKNGFSECIEPFPFVGLISLVRDELPPSIGRGENTIWAWVACGESLGLSSDLYFTRGVTFYDFIYILLSIYMRAFLDRCLQRAASLSSTV